jgi:hypothetical protein
MADRTLRSAKPSISIDDCPTAGTLVNLAAQFALAYWRAFATATGGETFGILLPVLTLETPTGTKCEAGLSV